ncbi:hypothetical protein [Streptomyces sp. RB17]|uniref:hypothetical protein n=1 Tax=Streptomyces sp. RB17 TaxID=2585197 RepID=UPI0012955A72|nr:hypothetical protein [Streptomyces sp. RB17]
MQVIIGADANLAIAATRPVLGDTADGKARREPALTADVSGDGACFDIGLTVPGLDPL